ncbi:RNA polymerase sigma factor (sigma-70 family) [Catalinimonas alkaloidigena]|uniref:RNA polymerase sigma factor n=1 Tax=Catalinimonas alkaloidigena TaxID=1075417 RepID=UPI002406B1DB|nr:RNA polymerase sigma factor [Catalinimonas alkaloidigena]MDF9797715.1 RNA polymerase sigma factor (sigma-70 family) [Catalinimonas alkaloidigena]
MKKDKETFLRVLEQHKKIIFKVCNAYCYDPEDRKDLVQEVIVQLWRSFSKYDEQYKLSTWMYSIALNVAISFYRKESKISQRTFSLNDSFLLITETEDHADEENLKLLRQFINQLAPLNRALMILYLDEHSHEEIANILEISVSNVGTKINRIKQKLRKQFATLEK